MRICQPPENSSVRRFQSSLREAQAGEHGAHLRFDRVAVARAELAVDALEAVGDLRVFRDSRIELAHAVRELFHLLLQRAQVGEDGHALGEDGAAGERQAVLRQVAEGGVPGAR